MKDRGEYRWRYAWYSNAGYQTRDGRGLTKAFPRTPSPKPAQTQNSRRSWTVRHRRTGGGRLSRDAFRATTEEGFDPVTTGLGNGVRQCCDFIMSPGDECEVSCNEKVTRNWCEQMGQVTLGIPQHHKREEQVVLGLCGLLRASCWAPRLDWGQGGGVNSLAQTTTFTPPLKDCSRVTG